MSVDLADYTDNLRRVVDPPGVVIDAEATDDDYAGRLVDAYWICVLQGFDYIRNNFNGPDIGASGSTVVTPLNTGGVDLPRDIVQLVIFTAGIDIVKTRLLNLRTQFSAKAGPVSFEYEQSSQAWQLIYKDLLQQRSFYLRRLSDIGILPTIVFNSLTENDWQLYTRETFWERS